MKILGEWRYRPTHSSTSAVDGGEWPASFPGRFTPRNRDRGTHSIGGWVCPSNVYININSLRGELTFRIMR
jgi:hypothetical protein